MSRELPSESEAPIQAQGSDASPKVGFEDLLGATNGLRPLGPLGPLRFLGPWAFEVGAFSIGGWEVGVMTLPWLLLGSIENMFPYGGLVVEIQPLNC